MNKKNMAIYQGLYALSITVIVVIVYLCNFHDHFSEQGSDWGNFGSYVGGAAGTIISLLNLWLIINNSSESRILDDKKNTPIIVFEVNEGIVSLRNIGLGTGVVNFCNYDWLDNYETQLKRLFEDKKKTISICKNEECQKFNLSEALNSIRDKYVLRYMLNKTSLIIAPNEREIIFSITTAKKIKNINDSLIFNKFLEEIFKLSVTIKYEILDIISTNNGSAIININDDKICAKYDFIHFNEPVIIQSNKKGLLQV